MNILAPLALALSVSTNDPHIESPLQQLEILYWDCDFATSNRMLTGGEAAACSEAYEQIKHQKFDGNFHRFMEWWKSNKQQEYAKRVKR